MRKIVLCAVVALQSWAAIASGDAAFKFASVAYGQQVTASAPEVAEAKVLLAKAAKQYGVSEEMVADMVIKTRDLAAKDKIPYRMFEVLEALPLLDPAGRSSKERMIESLAAYMTVRRSGANHSEALVGVRSLRH